MPNYADLYSGQLLGGNNGYAPENSPYWKTAPSYGAGGVIPLPGVTPSNPAYASVAPGGYSGNAGSVTDVKPGTDPISGGSVGGYNPSPTPQNGNGAFGLVPGQLGLPNPAGNLAAQLPGLGSANSAATAGILSELHGQLPQDVIDQIHNHAAQFGVSSGMPGSQFAGNRGLRDLGLTSLQLQQQGFGNLNALASQTSQTQTLNPALATQIAETNATNAAAPDPTKSASYAKSLFDEYLAKTQAFGLQSQLLKNQPRAGTTTAPQYGGGGGFTPFYSGGGSMPQNFLGGSLGYDANGYPTSSYAPGSFPGTNGTTGYPPAQIPGAYDSTGAYSAPSYGVPGPWQQTSGYYGQSGALPGYALDPYGSGSDQSYDPFSNNDYSDLFGG